MGDCRVSDAIGQFPGALIAERRVLAADCLPARVGGCNPLKDVRDRQGADVVSHQPATMLLTLSNTVPAGSGTCRIRPITTSTNTTAEAATTMIAPSGAPVARSSS